MQHVFMCDCKLRFSVEQVSNGRAHRTSLEFLHLPGTPITSF